MDRQRGPWFLGLATLAALFLSRGPASSPGAEAPTGPTEPWTGAWKAARAGVDPQAVHPFVRLYDEYFGVPLSVRAGTPQVRGTWGGNKVDLRISAGGFHEVTNGDLELIAERANGAKYCLEFLVALVPDPIESQLPSNFDLTVAGLQSAMIEEGYLLDGKWLPWTAVLATGGDAGGGAARQTAGILLYRKEASPKREASKKEASKSSPSSRLLAAFLVGETPSGGIHRQAFQHTVDFITKLEQAYGAARAQRQQERPEPAGCPDSQEIRVLGPSFSGSAESLRIAIDSWHLQHQGSTLASRPFRVVTGSATAPEVADHFSSEGQVTFSRTVVPDDLLNEKAYVFLKDGLGWDLDHAALLIEGDTGYGKGERDANEQSRGPHPRYELPFPSGLSSIRNAWEESRAGKVTDRARGEGKELAVGKLKTPLEISLADPAAPSGGTLELSPLTSRIEEMAMANLLRSISRKDIRYIGILGTDVKDELFLAEQIRRWAPDVILFMFESNLIYVHPESQPAMFGSLAITSFPLLNSGLIAAPTKRADGIETIGQFASEVQDGVARATRCLLKEKIEAPAVWIVATGNDGVLPVARIRLEPGETAAFMGACSPSSASPKAPPKKVKIVIFPERNDLQLFLLLVALCLCAHWLGEHAYFERRRSPTPTAVDDPENGAPEPAAPDRKDGGFRAPASVLLVLGESVLCLMGAGIAFLAYLPWRPWSDDFELPAGSGKGLHILLLIATLGAYAYLLYRLVKTASSFLASRGPRRRGWSIAATLLCGALLFWAMEAVITGLWAMRQPVGFLYLRARIFATGLSPLVSLACVGGALLVWLSVELRRQQLRQRYEVSLPFREDSEPAFQGSGRFAKELEDLLARTIPRRRGLWLLIAAAMLPTAALLWKTTQPLADPRGYGRIFVLLLLSVFVLSVTSFYRFISSWMLLRRILGRLEHCRCRRFFTALSTIVRWNPMESFAWYTPSFTSLAQWAARQEELELAVGPLPGSDAQEVSRRLGAAFGAEADGRFSEEVSARESVATALHDIGERLAASGFLMQVQELNALQVVGYLRHLFAQLRFALMGAMVPSLLLIVALNRYTFVPNRYLLVLFWAAELSASAASLIVFVQISRDMVLRDIGGNGSGKASFDRALLSNIFAYAILPLVALVSSQIPEVGQTLGHWVDPLMRILAVG
jgi:hypothetical protein